MKVQNLPSWSAEALEHRLPTANAGTVLALNAGPGATAVAIKLDPAALDDPARYNSLVATALGITMNPATVKRLNAVGGAVNDASTMFSLANPGHALPVAGVLDGFAVLTSSVTFMQALHEKKGILHVSLAGAEMVANVADAFIKTPTTTIVATLVRNLTRATDAIVHPPPKTPVPISASPLPAPTPAGNAQPTWATLTPASAPAPATPNPANPPQQS